MKFALLLYFLSISGICFSQIIVTGTVNTNNRPLQSATVYLNNTTIGGITDRYGQFRLKVPEGTYELIVSYVGLTTKQVALKTANYTKPLEINLVVKDNVLEEVLLKPKNDSLRIYHLIAFKDAFLGRTIQASTCKIENEKDLHFDYDAVTNVLKAYADKPLRIVNKGLGYEVHYDLLNFTLTSTTLVYLGRTQFKELEGGKGKMKRWSKNRKTAFLGSRPHFVRSLRNHELEADGFIVHQFSRVRNPDRPSDGQIRYARNFIKTHREGFHFSKKITVPKTKMDSMIVTVRKASLPKFRVHLYNKNVLYADMIRSSENDSILEFNDYLSVIYTRAQEETRYVTSGLKGQHRKAGPQSSSIKLLTADAILDPTGDIIKPLDVFVDGYWGFIGFAQALPLDYVVPIE